MSTTDREFGDIGTKVLSENDRIRVWEMRLDPGESSALHTHEHDYVMIQIAGDKVCADFAPDSQDEFNGAALGRVEGPVNNGTVIFAHKGGIERAQNTGSEQFYEIVVELLD